MCCPSFTVIYKNNVCHLTSCFVGHVVSGIPLFSSMLKVLFNVCCVCLACGRMGCGWHESTCVYVLFLIYSSCCTFGISFGIFGDCVWERVSFVLGSCAFLRVPFLFGSMSVWVYVRVIQQLDYYLPRQTATLAEVPIQYETSIQCV